jgi:hypothetical protein
MFNKDGKCIYVCERKEEHIVIHTNDSKKKEEERKLDKEKKKRENLTTVSQTFIFINKEKGKNKRSHESVISTQ